MQLNDILVHIDATVRSDARVTLAASLAQRHGAHLTGIYVIEPESADPLLPTAVPYGNASPTLTSAATKSRVIAPHAERHFRDTLTSTGIVGEWRKVDGVPEQIVALNERYADLLVVGQSNPKDPIDFGTMVGTHSVLTSGRPVLVIPYTGQFDALATNVIVAWTDTREAARALNDAMPLLAMAEKVTVLAVNPHEDRATDSHMGGATDVALHLARHGVKAEAARLDMKEVSVGDTILNRSFDLGADLLVCGAYGHSKVRELLLGGVTRDLFDHMTLPVFMSH